jgi:hypothetical protein
MGFEPEKITKEHILGAIARIEQESIPLEPSTRFDVLVNGKYYPPKEVMRFAHEAMNGERIWQNSGGHPTNKFFDKLGFVIHTKAEAARNFRNSIQFTGRVIKLGCSWGEGAPSFYDLIKQHKIVITDNEFEAGDLILVTEGFQALAVAQLLEKMKPVTTNIYLQQGFEEHDIDYSDNVLFGIAEWFEIPKEQQFQYKLRQGIRIIQDKDVREKVISLWERRNVALVKNHEENISINNTSNMDMKNIILYGPPGTGKTYNTINKAVIIANPSFNFSGKTRDVIKKEYDRLVGLGRINFVTFHQSLSYEDFIEGIKPKTLKDQVVYEIEEGVFKVFCNKARFINGNFDDVIEKFKKDISEGDGQPPLKIKGQGTTFDITYRGTNVFYVQPLNSTKENPWYPVNIENIRKAFETDSYERIYNPTYVREAIVHLKKNYGLVKGNAIPASQKENYVFIIDEINRGNVSQIFGELITLIEADKREDQPEALQIQLPYSKELFSVPDNVYIVGTMNTADRSVEALDTALRRRFSFEFMPPDSTRIEKDGKEIDVKGISLKTLLDTINQRVTYLLDEDHQIGHAYFCSIEQDNEEQLKVVFKNKIIPLLREYFYNDHAKIRMVLGDSFVSKSPAKPKFAVKDEEEFISDKSCYKIVDFDKDFDIIAAVNDTLHGKG